MLHGHSLSLFKCDTPKLLVMSNVTEFEGLAIEMPGTKSSRIIAACALEAHRVGM